MRLWSRTAARAAVVGVFSSTFVLGAGVAASSASAAPTVAPTASSKQVTEVIAHRGMPNKSYSENTPGALRRAFDNGADAVEFDVVYTKDKRLVVMHDADLKDHTTKCSGQASDRSYDYVRSCKTKDGRKVPNLYEMLMEVRDAGKRAYVHVKTPAGKGLASSYMNAVNKYKLNSKVVFYSSSASAVDEIKKKGAANVGLGFNDSQAKKGWAAKYKYLFPYDTKLSKSLVEKAQDRGAKVIPTDHGRIDLDDAFDYKVDGFMANDLLDALDLLKP